VLIAGVAGAGLWYAGYVPDLTPDLALDVPDLPPVDAPEPEPEAAPELDLTGDEAFVAAMAAVPTEPCARENGVRDARAKFEIRVAGGRVIEAMALDGFGDAAFARCLVAELYGVAVATEDGRGVRAFEHAARAGSPRPARPTDAPPTSGAATSAGATSAPPTTAPRAPATPQACGFSSPEFGPIAVGVEVEVGRHRAVGGDDNWASSMDAFVGQRGRVRSLNSSTDGAGCSIVRLDVDDGAWNWRVRDLKVVSGGGGGGSSAIPQACGQSEGRYGPLAIGAKVTPGRHRAVDGEPNWSSEMEAFVGRPATVTALEGVDAEGCTLVRLDAATRRVEGLVPVGVFPINLAAAAGAGEVDVWVTDLDGRVLLGVSREG
jgi:hypothetical protein